MTDMVTRVARALWDSAEVGEFDAQPDSIKNLYRHGARAAIKAMPAWQPIETAPKDGTWIFLYWNGMSVSKYPCVGFNVGGYWEEVGVNETLSPTHWMPLPAPPALKSHEDKSALRGEEKADG